MTAPTMPNKEDDEDEIVNIETCIRCDTPWLAEGNVLCHECYIAERRSLGDYE
jgi:hypothetical protein